MRKDQAKSYIGCAKYLIAYLNPKLTILTIIRYTSLSINLASKLK